MDYSEHFATDASASSHVEDRPPAPKAPRDGYNRRIDYLRLSITDLCNLRCIYCMPEEGVPKMRHDDILTYEEISRIAHIAVGMGISRIRITGGEPLVRRDVIRLCEDISGIPNLKSLAITTNGALLSRFAKDLRRAGVQRVNVSLDTLDPEKYARITRRDAFHDVWRGIEAALDVGLQPVKLNVVVMRGVNDDEIEKLAALSLDRPFHVRFIEFMPFQGDSRCGGFVPSDEILSRLSGLGKLSPVEDVRSSNGPARLYAFPGATGRIGVISPVSNHFCPSCNRLRCTADGKLRTCLFSAEETDVRTALRQGAPDARVVSIIREALRRKPERHHLDEGVPHKCMNRPMSAIGG
jgi:cyclic pyranopterin phosphate synthase